MKNCVKTLWRLVLLSGVAAFVAHPLAQAQTSLHFSPFKDDDIEDSSLDVININGTVISIANGTRFGIINNSIPNGSTVTPTRPTVTQIYWDTNSSFVPTSTSYNSGLSSSSVVFESGGSPSNLPGGNEIDFSSNYRFSPDSPSPHNGIDPSEVAYFDFIGVSYTDVILGLSNGSIRIGMHIQEVGSKGKDSVSFVNDAVPEPSVILLSAFGVLGLMRRRR
jgi:hypothetical protein